ncbi:MAG: hypothetical protein QGF46_07555, partial [Planctomycetota bacterium]|nr:hypothetical protein [Planctomycetota bacterium]
MIAIPILLLILGAVLGGLKSLLQSSTGKHPTITDDSVHQRLSLELERRPNLARASGLARMFLVIGAAFLFTQYI